MVCWVHRCVTVGDMFWWLQRRKFENHSQWYRHSRACQYWSGWH